YLLTSIDGATWLTVNTVFEPNSPPALASNTIAGIYELFESEPRATVPNSIVRSADVMPAEEWKEIVRQIEQNMHSGELKKVVLARQFQVEGRATFDPALVLERLRADYADCFVFAIAHNDRCFLGASPERLVQLREQRVR